MRERSPSASVLGRLYGARVDSGLAGRPIAVAQTQPYGCEVKY